MKHFFMTLATLLSTLTFAQTDSTETESVKGTWDINLDIASRYIWRGQTWGGNSPVAQLYGTYNVTDKLSFGIWTTTNFKSKNYKNDGNDPDGYQEIDLIANYAFTDYFTTSLQWYYWPTVELDDAYTNKLFDFGNQSVNTIDLILMFDFTEKGFPLFFNWSTLLAGNDFKYKNEDDVDGTQNFTSYAEVGYSFDLPLGLNLTPVVGAVLNNKAGYYTYGDRDKVSFVNMGARLTKEFTLSDNLTLPIWLNYTHNAANKEFSAPEGSKDIKQDYIVLGATLTFSK